MFEAIIFDVDGTLSETEEIHRRAFNQAFEMMGLSWHWDRSKYRQLLQVTGGKERIRHFIERHDPDLLHTEDLDGFVRGIHKTKTTIYTQLLAHGEAVLRPGIRETISLAIENGRRLAIATTTSPPNIEALLKSAYGNDGPGIFDVICAGDSVRRKKPAPDIYLLTLKKLGLAAEDCVAIEDSRNGLLSSSGAGIPTIVTPSIYTDHQSFDEAAVVTDKLSRVDLAAIFESRSGP
jgi:HAD superfamily hydrolase (TIGR01509 family)